MEEIENLLTEGVSAKRVVAIVEELGISFEVTAEVKERLRRAGAGPEVIQGLEKIALERERKRLEEERRKAEEERHAEVEKRKAEERKLRAEEEKRQLEAERQRLEAERDLVEERKKLEAERQALEEQRRKLQSSKLPRPQIAEDARDVALRTLRSVIEGEDPTTFFARLLGGSAKSEFHELTADYFVTTFGWQVCSGYDIQSRSCRHYTSRVKAQFRNLWSAKFWQEGGTVVRGHLCLNADDAEWLERERPPYRSICVVLLWKAGPDVLTVRKAVETLAGKELLEESPLR
ncbi:MAG: hypothetical protein HY694_15160 [Deltaproteobacteria bacterium]|nr:hypothetical protein [Deltaproteobacteria bacterium]